MVEDIEDIVSGERGSGADIGREERTDKVVRVGLKLKDLRRRKNKTSGSKEWPNVENGGADEANSHSECDCGGQACNGEDFGEGNHIGALDPEEIEAVKGGVPGTASVWVKTFGCSHNASDSEYMAGQLQAYGYRIVDNSKDADLWLVNTCTVKNPSETAMVNIVAKGRDLGKPMVVAGCVPQGDKKVKGLENLTLLGVSQIDRVVEAVEETLQGNAVQLLAKKELPRLNLPKVRRNEHIEIIPLSTGCLGNCTYCKTKHARGELGSYDPQAIVDRAKAAADDPRVREIWLSSEDTGAYGRDLGIKLPHLLRRIVQVLPKSGRTRLRVGMSNPPFMLDTLDEIAEVLNHPLVFSYLHIPVQSGSNAVLKGMNREYTAEEFRTCADTLLRLVPSLELATDIICGFPGETDEDHKETIELVKDYAFPHCHISQFYPRPGTPAARMKRVKTQIVKARSREVSALVDSFVEAYAPLEGTVHLVSIVEKAADKVHLVGHTRSYAQILIAGPRALIGTMVYVRVTKATRWSAFGDLLDLPLSRDITEGVEDFSANFLAEKAPSDAVKDESKAESVDRGRGVAAMDLSWIRSHCSSFAAKFTREGSALVLSGWGMKISEKARTVDVTEASLLLGLGIGIAGIALASTKVLMARKGSD